MSQRRKLVLILVLFLKLMSGQCLKCYHDKESSKVTKCDENLGYRTCFIRYDEKGLVTGRGCSTKDKVYYKECETHSYGEGTEKFCYCNFYLCNGGAAATSPSNIAVVISTIVLAASSSFGWWQDQQ